MRKTWEPKIIRMIPRPIDSEKYDQRIAEAARVLYDHFRQLDRPILALPTEDRETPSNEPLLERRTGTHG